MLRTTLMKAILLTAMLLASGAKIIAQTKDLSNELITWSSSSFIDSSTNNSTVKETTFVTGPQRVSWIQDGYEQEFEIISRQWNWRSQNGNIIYNVKFGDSQGVMEFIINSKEIRLIIDIKGNTSSFQYSFEISKYTY